MDDVERLRDLITRHARDGITATPMGGVQIMRSETTTQPLGQVTTPSLVFVLGGAKEALLADDLFRYGTGQYLVVGVALPVTAHISEASPRDPFIGMGLELEPAVIASLLLEAGPAGPPAERPPLGIAVSDADEPLLGALARLLTLLDQPAHIPGLGPAYKREILWRAMVGPQGEIVRQIGMAGGRLTMVAKAIRHIRDHYSEPIRIEQLAELSAMSPATLHRHFRSVTSMTPIQFQKQLRLQEARKLLVGDPEDVASAGFAVGYESASQFNREYRRMFGAPPGRDARALRDAAAGAVPTI